jgi:hypothetical protein
MERDYVIKSGDEYLVWWEAGTAPSESVFAYIRSFHRQGLEPAWNEVDGHKWCWSGQGSASRFTWREARDVVWNKLKTLKVPGSPLPPLTDRWRYKLSRLVPKGDTIRPADAR